MLWQNWAVRWRTIALKVEGPRIFTGPLNLFDGTSVLNIKPYIMMGWIWQQLTNNKEGTQVWGSVWGRANIPDKTGEIVVYDDKTLAAVARIPDLMTPTGKFNVYNTVKDIC